jgi:hypothetical protein
MMVKQLSLFNQPSLNINRSLKEQMAHSAKESKWSREEILDRMNDLANRYGVRLMKGNGKALTMTTFEKWLNVGAMEHIPPVNSLVIFCAAIGDNSTMCVLMEPLGEAVIDDQDTKLLLWAKEYHLAKSARQNMKKLEAEL